MIELLTFLAALGCSPQFALQYDATLDRPGRQAGILVRVRTSDPGVWVHELVHVCQEQAQGPAWSDAEAERREAEARTVELLWRQRDR
jgi:hypothetical protein